MKVIYDKETDTLSIIFRSVKVAESDEARPGLIFDYDKAGRLVSIELLDASEQVDGAESVEFALAGGELQGYRKRSPKEMPGLANWSLVAIGMQAKSRAAFFLGSY